MHLEDSTDGWSILLTSLLHLRISEPLVRHRLVCWPITSAPVPGPSLAVLAVTSLLLPPPAHLRCETHPAAVPAAVHRCVPGPAQVEGAVHQAAGRQARQQPGQPPCAGQQQEEAQHKRVVAFCPSNHTYMVEPAKFNGVAQ